MASGEEERYRPRPAADPTDDAPALSVIVAAPAADGPASACLDALSTQLDGAVEVLVVGDERSVDDRRWVRVLPSTAARVPELWSRGIGAAEGRVVGLLASTVVPDAGWVERAQRVHDDGVAAVGGPIEPGAGLRLADWALYFCRYAPYLRPLPAAALEVPADNASYRADVLGRYADAYADGFWEPFVHACMRADGHRLTMDPDRVVRLRPGARVGTFARQRFAHGRAHGRRRSATEDRRRRLLGIVSSPAVPAVMTARVIRTVWARRRHRARLLLAAPLVVWFHMAWAAGELTGRLDVARGRT